MRDKVSARLDAAGYHIEDAVGQPGLLGGFTTFSSFSVELVAMVWRGEAMIAAAYAVSSVVGGVMAAYLGIMLGRG